MRGEKGTLRGGGVVMALIALAFGLANAGWAQPTAASGTEDSAIEASKSPARMDRPRIGLALSGGGARGLAHVGALQALESLNIPIDYIAGTSMGAVVGGMYALGMSPDEIEAELASVDWTDMFRGSAARKDLSFRRKEDERKFLYGAEIGFTSDGIRFPGGTIPSVSLDFFLDSLSLRYGPTGSFDDLTVPFRAVASDVRSGEVVILDHGELSTAVRASMAVPGVLAPVQIGPYSLVDGGVLDNLPVEVVQSMGADIVIAVDVSSPLLGAKEVQSAPSIASQALSLALEQRSVESRGEADILIRPDLGKLSPLDFGQVGATMPLGREATLALSDRLADLSDPKTAQHLYALHRRTPNPLPVVESIEILGPTRVDLQRIRQRILTRIGEVVDLEVLHHDLARVFSIGEFSAVRFAFEEPLEEGRLLIRVEDKDWGPNYLRLGLGFSDDLEGSNGVSARLNYTMTNLNRYGGEWRNEIQTGRTRGLLTEFFQPLDYDEHFFIAPRVVSRQAVSDIFVERTKIAEYEVESHSLGLDFGLEFGKYGEFRLGLRRGIAKADARVGDPGLPELDVDTGAMVGRLVIDRLDSSGVPRRGTLADVSLFVSETSLGADDTYQKLGGETSTYFTHGRHTGFVGLSGGSSLGSDAPAYDAFLVGGLFSFSGYSVGELRGDYYAVARSGYFYRLYDLPVAFGTAIYVGGWVEAGNVWQDSSEIDLEDPLGSFTLALAIDTRFGPVYLAHGLADDGGSQFYFRLGNSF